MEISSFLSLCVTRPELEACDGRQPWQVMLLLRQDGLQQIKLKYYSC